MQKCSLLRRRQLTQLGLLLCIWALVTWAVPLTQGNISTQRNQAALAPHAGPGALAGWGLGQLHVWWRHTGDLGWRSPRPLRAAFGALGIVLPEDHDGHHRNPSTEFGDIFRFYDAPARALLAALAPTRRTRSIARPGVKV